MNRFTLTISDDLLQVIRSRASLSRRSISGEIIYLVEAALAAEMEGDTGLMRALYLLRSESRPEPEQTGRA